MPEKGTNRRKGFFELSETERRTNNDVLESILVSCSTDISTDHDLVLRQLIHGSLDYVYEGIPNKGSRKQVVLPYGGQTLGELCGIFQKEMRRDLAKTKLHPNVRNSLVYFGYGELYSGYGEIDGGWDSPLLEHLRSRLPSSNHFFDSNSISLPYSFVQGGKNYLKKASPQEKENIRGIGARMFHYQVKDLCSKRY